jgi:ATP-binding cassette subfamily F protein uup
MNLLSVELLSKSYGTKKLFEGISFGINQGERVGLIAKNGAGKTTLLKILEGAEIADEGKVVFRKNLSISFLEQYTEFDTAKSVMEVVLSATTEIKTVIDQFNNYSALAGESPSEFNLNKLDELTVKMTELNGWDYENKLEEILSRLKIKDTGQKIGELSGGQQKRVALAKILIQEPELLVLDEPTNHLDVEMIEWLENYILSREMSVLLITHDRYFLNSVCNRIIELEHHRLYFYLGNFEYFLEKKAERES